MLEGINRIHCKEYEIKNAKEKVPVIAAKAPGVIHFLGGHSSPFAGLFLSTAIDRYVQIAISPRNDNSMRFYSADFGERRRANMNTLKYKREDRWANYIKTAIYTFIKLGFPVKGMNFTISGNIPLHIGLASSSAIEIAALTALRSFFNSKIDESELVRYLAKSHQLIFGKNPDLAAYIAGLYGKKDQFLLINEADLSIERIKSPFSNCKIILIDSRVHRHGAEKELATRRNELKSALDMLSRERMGLDIRELEETELLESMGGIPEEIRRRILHIVQENRRMHEAKNFLLYSDLLGFSRTIFNSHESLRDLFELSCPEIDWLVKRTEETDKVYGARMNGNGLRGCVYAILKNDAVKEFKKRIEDYEKIFGFQPALYGMKFGRGSQALK